MNEIDIEDVMDKALEFISITKNPSHLVKYNKIVESLIEKYGAFLLEYKDELEEETVTEAEFSLIQQQDERLLREMDVEISAYLEKEKAFNAEFTIADKETDSEGKG